MKSKIACKSCPELVGYLQELCTYFGEFGIIPVEEKPGVPLPVEGVLRIRFDHSQDGGAVKITVDW